MLMERVSYADGCTGKYKEEPLGMRLGGGSRPIVFLLLIVFGLTVITNRQLMKISPVSS